MNFHNNEEENGEKNKVAKEKKLEDLLKRVEETGDRLGLSIDEKIKETVAFLNANEIRTSGSCQGHHDWGVSAPWVEIEADDKPEETYVAEKEIYKEIARKRNLSVEQVKKPQTDEENQAWRDVWIEIDKIKDIKETEEYKKWGEENLKLYNKVKALLDEFYKDREIESDSKIIVSSKTARHGFRIHNGGDDYEPVIKDGKKPENKEQELLAKKLKKYQKEMQEFANFLKGKYLKNKF